VEAVIDIINESERSVTAEESPRLRLTDGTEATRAKAPTATKVMVATVHPTTANPAIDIVGCPVSTPTHGADTWRLVSQTVELPNELWNEGDGTSSCTIAYFLHKHRFPNGAVHVAYAVSIDGYDGLYAVKADTIARHVDKATRQRLRKQPLPKPAAQPPRLSRSASAPPTTPKRSPPPSPPSSPIDTPASTLPPTGADIAQLLAAIDIACCSCARCTAEQGRCENDVLQANGLCQLCNENFGFDPSRCNCPCDGCNPATPSSQPPAQPVGPPPGQPPPSPPPSPAGGDNFGTKRRSPAANWGRKDKASKERARRRKWHKLGRALEKKAMSTRHPQECPVCMDKEQSCLLYNCGNHVFPYHRYHGLCDDCAYLITEGEFDCPLCGLPVQSYLNVGTEFFVQN
jgi:hypothetical protein